MINNTFVVWAIGSASEISTKLAQVSEHGYVVLKP